MRKIFTLLFIICCAGLSQIYAAAAPANDDCAGAITLTVGASCTYTTYTNANATASEIATPSIPAPGCASYSGGDVWFKVVVPASGHITFDSQTGVMTDGGMAVYSGACGSLALIACNDDGSANGLMPMLDQTGLTPGSTVYIRFWEYFGDNNGTFGICVSDPPAATNNNCSTATSLTPGASCTATAGSVVGATQSQAGCLGTANDDVWYSFVAQNASQNITVTPSASFDPVVQLFSGTCASLTSISCNDATFLTGTAGTMNATGLTVGQTYYYRIYDYYSGVPATTTFTTCITNPGVPNNQDCLGAIPICNSTYSTAIAYSGTGNILNEINSGISCLGAGEKHDVWYVFTVQTSGNLDFTITPNDGTEDYDWAVYNLTTANCSDIYSNAALEVSCNFSANIGCSGLTGPNGNTTGPCGLQNEAVVPVTAGQTYVVNVSQYSATQNGYAIDFGASTATIFDNVPPAFSSVNTPIACGATSLTFNFSENVKCSTVSTADFTLTGPGGPYTITGWSSANCSAGAAYDNTFTITVNPPLTTSGTFSLCLVNTAGSVSDVCNNIAPPACFNYTISTIVLSTSQTNVTCNGGTNGVASVAITSGGTAPFSYVWNDPAPVQTTATATGLAAGTYTVTVTDALGCMAQATVTVTQPSGMTLTAVPTNATCGASNGSINLTVTGGTAPFTYLWTNGSTIQDPTGLAAGSYTVTVTMAGGCTANLTQAITTTAVPTATFTYNGNQCLTGNSFNFTNTGTSGGGATYSWSFTSGTPATSTTNNPNGVTWSGAGTYSISHTVTQSGCSTTVTQNIVVYPNPAPGVTQNNVTCNGACNGSATANPSGGAGFTYLWSNGATTQTISGLCAGSYTVTVTNSNSCTGTQTISITQPAVLTLVTSRTNATCNGVCNGTGNVTPSGGSGTYTYLWDNGQTTQGSTGLCAGNHTVTVTDASSPLCTQTAVINISQPTLIVLTPSSTNATCGLSNGSASVAVAGGTAPYTYSWSSGGATNSITGLAAGSYTVTVTDNTGCLKTTTINITNTTAPTANISTSTNVSCNGGNNGSATVTVAGGTAPFTYSWTGGQTSATAINLTAGTYTVTVTDFNSCTITTSINITQPTILNASISAQTNNTCYGTANGTATVLASGGTAPYSYSWNTTPAQTTVSAINLTAGTYTVTVTDNNGCTKTTTVIITAPTELIANITIHTNVSCFGGTNGSATVVASGGTPGYTYTWNPSGQTTTTASNLPAGTYNVTVVDANGCTANASTTTGCFEIQSILVDACYSTEGEQEMVFFQVGPNALNTSTLSVTWPSNSWQGVCTDPVFVANANATITGGGSLIEPIGGVIPAGANVIFVTSTAQDISYNSFANLTGPTYIIFQCAGNTNGHFANYNATPGIRTLTMSFGGVCNDAVSYNISSLINQTGGSSSQNGASVNFTDAGTATYVNNGCVIPFLQTNVTITQPTALTASVIGTNVLCNGGNTGTATLTVTGGVTPYTYTWSNTATTQNLTGLVAGTYTVTVTDANNCTITASVTITQPSIIILTPSSTNATCGSANGTAGIVAAGGTSPFTYLWTSGQTTASITGLVAGAYTVTVTDINGCTANNTINVSNLGSPTASISAQINVNCNGGNNGSATVSAAGGTSPYTYLWTGGQTTITASNLTAGTYTVTVTDANSCSTNATVTITQPTVLTAVISGQTNVNCNGGNNGSATVSAGGGTVPYTYLWTGGQTSATATNLSAGTYTVTVTDFKSCTQTTTVTITQPSVLSATINGINVLCNGGNTGSANLTVTGGTSPYTFIWSNTATTEDLTNLITGTYTVTVTDNMTCTSNASITITQPTVLSLTPSTTNATCGAANGTAGITASGGTSPYTYLWSGGQTTASISGLTAGSYSVTVTDASGCTATNTINVSNTGSPTASISSQINILCNGNSTGSATVTAIGGTAPYTYLWTGGQTTVTATNLAAGSFTVTVTDNNSCSTTATVTITQPAALTASISGQVNINCNGGNNGSATVSSGGGIPPYTYLWTGGQTNSTATNLTSGAYTVTVTDANLCTITTIATLTQPAILTAVGSGLNITCNGGSDGTATATPSGGTTPYTYFWQNLQTTQTATGLTAGTYNVTVTDVNLCTTTTSYTVTEPAAMTLTPGTIDATCGNPNGTASVAVAGGTAPYTYLWSTGGTSNSIAGIIAGAYSVTVTDNNSCAQNTTIIINNTGAPTASLTINSQALCNGVCNGDATVSALGGTPPYISYLWSNGGSGLNVTGLCAGTISVTVTDNAGCSATASGVITEPVALSSLISAQTNVTCFGGNNGSATVSASGGTNPYSYSWQGGGSGASNNSLSAGSYNVTVTDFNSCTAITTATITAPADLTLSLSSQTNVLCNGGTTGTATVTAGGGTTPYTYSWSNGATGVTASGLTAAAYTVTVTDANLCIETLIITITEPVILTVSIASQTNVSCNTGTNGSATALASGGTAGYTYIWSNTATGATAGSLSAGIYSVTATDANSCTAITSVTITEPVVLSVTITSQTNVSCNAGTNGSATALASGGTAGYTYVWSNASTGTTTNGLSANTYTVTATDANLCTATTTATISQPTALTSSISSQTNVSCNGGNNGVSSVTASGGTLPYTYNWTNGSSSSNASNLTAGTFTVTVTDANLCTSIVSVTITEPTIVTATVAGSDADCNGAATGSATVTPGGGVPGYTYSWSNGASGITAGTLSAGNYTVTVTDASGCTTNTNVTINEPTALAGTASSTSETIFGLCDGTTTASPSGGAGGYTYVWSDAGSQTSQTASGLCVGTYTVTVTDINGCIVILSVTVVGPGALNLTATGSAVNCNGNCTGTSNVSVSGGQSPFTYLWSDGQITDTATGLCAGTYSVTVTDFNGATANISATVTQPTALSSAINTQTNVLCNGGNNGTASVSPSGGTLPYTYLWTGGSTSSTAANLTAGNFNVTTTDALGCTTTSTVTITEPTALNASATGTDVLCNGGTTGSGTVTAGGGTPGYTYLWSNGATNINATGLSSGNYTVTITDINGCTTSTSVTISQPSVLGATIISSTDVTGFGASDGNATANGTNGTPGYTFAWSNGASGATANGLSSGTYTVTVTDLNGCTAVTTVTINEPGALIVTLVSSTDVTCNGLCNGTAAISVSGGITPYTYTWSSGDTITNPTGLCSGTHTVTVTDANGFTGNISVVINQPVLLSATIATNVSVTCNGGTDGSASIIVSGGITSYSYLWSNGNTTNSISNVAAGNYSVIVTDANLCTTTVNLTITEPIILAVTVNAVGANCGQPQGNLAANVSGGTMPYTYLWTDGQTTQTAINLIPGSYSITVTDFNNCTISGSGIISNIPGASLTIKFKSNTLCNGSCDGTAMMESTGGLTPYVYSCSSGFTLTTSLTNVLVPNLCAGIYFFTITDANGCQAIVTDTIYEPLPVIAAISASSDVTCNSGSNGTATVTGSGGTAPYTAIWSTTPAQTTTTANNLTAGTYTVTLSDANSCSAVTSLAIIQPTAISLSTNTNDAHCSQYDGNASVTASGGTVSTGYTYLWSGGSIPLNSDTVNGLNSAGSPYTVTVTDNNLCTATATVTIANLLPGTVSISAFTNITCNGAADGTATASMGGGQPPYTYSWNTTPVQTTITATNLSTGPATVSVTDAFNCIVSASAVITQPVILTNTFTQSNVTCFGICNGSLTSVPSGGTLPYSYNWSNFNSTASISNLCSGNYSVTVTDANNCTGIFTTIITQPTQISITGVVTDANCNSTDGDINASASGGTIGYSYLWNTGTTLSNLINVAAGAYTLSVTDGAGCVAFQNFNINNISGPTASISAFSNISCFGANDGTATVTVNGGSSMFSYQWNTTPAQITATATNLPQGLYTVNVTDTVTLCVVNASVTITQPATLTIQTVSNEPLCFGQCNGDATVIPFGGTAPYSFLWFGGGNNPNDSINTGLCSGSYTIVVTDANNCNTMQTVTINQPSFVSATATSNPQSCFNICDGDATVSPAGGTTPYTYLWSGNNQTTSTAVGLCANSYTVTVFDDNGCNTTANTTVTAPSPITIISTNIQHVSCFNGTNGRIILNVTGGTPTLSFLWSNGATSQNLIGIPFGNYCVTITDINSCSYDTCIIVSQPPQLQVSLTQTDETCYQFCDGTITPTATGGQLPYTYLWSNFSTSPTNDSLCPGTHFVTVTDQNNCQVSASADIVGYDILNLLIVDTVMATCGQANGSAIISVVGGSSNYTYQWPALVNSTSSSASNLAAGFYTITVTDDNGCTATMDINISNATGPVIDSVAIQNITCFGACNGSLQAYYYGSTATYNVVWSTTPQQTGDTALNLCPGTYSVMITDQNGCATSTSRTITQPPLFQSAITNYSNATCYGTCNGSATQSVNGGTSPYTYLWSNGATTNAVNNLCTGTYTVTASDANGCSSQNAITITQPDSLHISPTVTNVTCNGQDNGQIVAQVTGGTGYNYNWFPNVSSNSVAAPLAPGTYTLIVTDYYDLNCSTTGTYIITEPEIISLNTLVSPTTCGLSNGMAYIIGGVHGGTSPYINIWSPGNSTNDTLFNAASGTYQLQIIDDNNCTALFSVFVPAIAPPLLNSLLTTNVSCNGDSTGSATLNVKFGTPQFTYSLSPNIGSQTVIDTATASLNNLVAGIYSVTITDNYGCPIQTAFIITQPSPIHTFADGLKWICNGQSTTITANASGGTPPYIFTWSNQSTNQVQVVSPASTTNYSVYVTDQRNCLSDTGIVTIYVYPNVSVILTADSLNICRGSSTILHALASGGMGSPYNYHWESIYHNVQTFNDTTAFDDWTVAPVDTTTYIVHALDGCNSPSIGDTLTIIVWPVPQTSVTIDKAFGCEPLLVSFNNTANMANMTYVWNFNDPESINNSSLDKNPTHLFEQDGDYIVSLTVTTEYGCSASDNQTINVYPVPVAAFFAFPEVVDLFHSTVEFTDITVDVNYWSWDFGDNRYSGLQNPEHTFDHADTFYVSLIVKNQFGCKDTVMHPIIVEQEFTFYAPTAFDPNSPVNNVFNPQGVGIDERNYSLFVFDRWGQIMFETTDLYEYWNGRFNNKGQYVKSGSYVWVVKLKDIHGRWHEIPGNVTVIR